MFHAILYRIGSHKALLETNPASVISYEERKDEGFNSNKCSCIHEKENIYSAYLRCFQTAHIL